MHRQSRTTDALLTATVMVLALLTGGCMGEDTIGADEPTEFTPTGDATVEGDAGVETEQLDDVLVDPAEVFPSPSSS